MAPLIEPMPPITTTTKQMIKIWFPMPGNTDEIGAATAPAKAARAMPKCEDQGEQQGNIHAERSGHLAVAVAGPDHHANAGFVDHEIQQGRDRQAHRGDEEPVNRIRQGVGEWDRRGEQRRNRHAMDFIAE